MSWLGPGAWEPEACSRGAPPLKVTAAGAAGPPRKSPGVPCRVRQPRPVPRRARGGRGPTYCAGQLPGALLEQTHDLGLLRGRAAAADHRRALAGQLHELVLVVLEAHLAATGRGAGSPRSPRPRGSSRGPAPTSRESPEMTSAQSCFLRKAFSSRCASPRLATWKGRQ